MSAIQHYQSKFTQRLNDRLATIRGTGAQRFAQTIAKDVTDGNRDDRLRGVDGYGRPMPPRKKPRRDGANGDVMAPHGTASQTITRFFTKVSNSLNGWTMKVGWKDCPWIVYHAQGRVKGAPIRDIMHVSPKTWAVVRKHFREWKLGLFNQRGYRG
jgi:hypothetical protein